MPGAEAILLAAAQPDNPARLHLFAAVSRDLFRHTSKTLAPDPGGRVRRRRAAYPARHELPGPCIADADPLPGDLRAAAERLLPDALSALQELYALFFSYLEHALQPLEPPVTRAAVRAFVLEPRRELDDLTACHTVGDGYTETLTVSEPGARAISLEVEGALGSVLP